MQLSIITPYYNCYEYTKTLSELLIPQLTDEVEWIIIDDGCNEKRLDDIANKNANKQIRVIHLETNSGGASKPRNVGLDNAKGKYIAFIDADDKVALNYVKLILDKIKEDYDYFYISFLFRGQRVIIEEEPPKWNCCVWNTIYKSSIIGNQRFKEELILAEDYDFNKRVRKGIRGNLKKVLYFYTNNPNSLTKRSKK